MSTLPTETLPDQLITHENISMLSVNEQISRLSHLAMRMHITCQVNEQHMLTKTYDELVLFVRSPQVIKSAKDFLQGLHLCSLVWHNPEVSDVIGQTISVRMVLASYLVRLHANKVFEETTEETQSFALACDKFLEQFEEIKHMLVFGGTTHFTVIEKSKMFSENLMNYLSKYECWKVADATRLVVTIKGLLFGMQSGIFHIFGEHGEIDVGHPNVIILKEGMDRLMIRLVQFGGINEAFLFNKEVEGRMEQRRRLRLLREEQRRHAEDGFDFVEF
jgi:hypothetical protein